MRPPLLVDRAIEPTDSRIMVAALHGELTIKRLRRENDVVSRVAENSDFSPILSSACAAVVTSH